MPLIVRFVRNFENYLNIVGNLLLYNKLCNFLGGGGKNRGFS